MLIAAIRVFNFQGLKVHQLSVCLLQPDVFLFVQSVVFAADPHCHVVWKTSFSHI
jgi:hypothetical protein